MAQTTSRRSFFRGAGISAVAAVAGVPSFPASAAIPENPELLTLGSEFDKAEAAYAAADARYREARVPYDALRPAVPEELTPPGWRHPLGDGKPLYDAAGEHWNGRERVDVLTADWLRWVGGDYGPRTKVGRQLKRLLPIAERFDAAIREAEEQSGIVPAVAARKEARAAVEAAAKALLEAPARTTVGLVLKARSLTATSLMWDNGMSILSVTHGAKFAAEVVAIADGGRLA